MGDYKVQFEVFEGPLDLLLYLVKKEEVDVYEVNLTRLATQFIAYIELMRQLDLDVAGDFLVMASTLMYIKSRELLPRDQQVEAEGEEEEDPRWELIRQLVEYKKFKDAATQLQACESEQESTFPRIPVRPDAAALNESPRAEVSLFDLINAVGQVLKRVQERGGPREIYEDPWTVSQKIEHLRGLLNERSRVRFSELFATTTTRSEVVATFLALLELVRLKIVVAVQSAAFGEIDLEKLPDPAQPQPPNASVPAPSQPGAPAVA